MFPSHEVRGAAMREERGHKCCGNHNNDIHLTLKTSQNSNKLEYTKEHGNGFTSGFAKSMMRGVELGP